MRPVKTPPATPDTEPTTSSPVASPIPRAMKASPMQTPTESSVRSSPCLNALRVSTDLDDDDAPTSANDTDDDEARSLASDMEDDQSQSSASDTENDDVQSLASDTGSSATGSCRVIENGLTATLLFQDDTALQKALSDAVDLLDDIDAALEKCPASLERSCIKLRKKNPGNIITTDECPNLSLFVLIGVMGQGRSRKPRPIDSLLRSGGRQITAKNVTSVDPELWAHCCRLLDTEALEAIDDFLTVRLPELIDSLRSWVSAGYTTTEEKRELNFAGMGGQLQGMVSTWKIDMEKKVSAAIKKPLHRNIDEITNRNLETYASWDGKVPSFFWRRIKNKGIYRGTDWNVELIENMNIASAEGWTMLETHAKRSLKELVKNSAALMAAFEEEASDADAPQTLLQRLETRTRLLNKSQDRIIDNFFDGFWGVKDNATCAEDGSYVLRYMQPGYKYCKKTLGSGVVTDEAARNTKRHLRDHVSNPAFVTKQRAWVTEDLMKSIKATATDLAAEMDDTVAKVQSDLCEIELQPMEVKALFSKYPETGKEFKDLLTKAETTAKEVRRVVRQVRAGAGLKRA